MDPLNFILLIAGGVCIGLLAGLFGISEGLLLVPFLLAVELHAGVSSLLATHVAVGTTLLVVALNAVRTTSMSFRNGSLIRRAALVAGVAGMVGAFCCAALAGGFDGKTLRVLAGLATAVGAVRLFTQPRKPKGEQRIQDLRLAMIGVLGGGVSSLTGAGANLLTIPMLYSGERFPLTKAAGTSSAVVLMAALAGAGGYVMGGAGNSLLPEGFAGFLHPLPALLLAAGVLPGAIAGDRLSVRMKGRLARKLFAFLLLVIAVRMFLA